jgi:hypothetical protein
MNVAKLVIVALLLVLTFPSIALGKDKRGQRGMLESMQSVPCGAKERGVTGLGSVFASVGVEHVNSHEQLCPQYLLRTDEMDYHIRPVDLKHAAVLSVGHEAEFKIKKDRLFLRMVDGDKKELVYQVVAMQPANSASTVESTAYHPADKPAADKPAADKPTTGNPAAGNPTTDKPTVQSPAENRPQEAQPPNEPPSNGTQDGQATSQTPPPQ